MNIVKIPKCKRCALHLTRRKIVPGRGIIPADVLFIGEAPGRSEDLLGKAFIGRAGKVLDQLILDARINSFYITNVVLCRPTDSSQGDNRQPTMQEALACMPNVMKIVKQVRPTLVVLLGKVAQRYYGGEFPEAIHLHHPSFLARQGGIRSPHYLTNLRKLKEAVK